MKAEYMFKESGGDEKLMVVDGNVIIACDDYTLRPSQSDEKAVINCYVFTDKEGGRVRTGMLILEKDDTFMDHVNEREFLGFGDVCE